MKIYLQEVNFFMELLHNLWNVVSTEDENLTKYVLVFLGIIESFVMMRFFTTILDIKYTKKQKNLYVIIMEVLMIFSTFLIPKEISIFIHLIITFIVIKLVFKTTIIKSILAEIIPMLVSVIIESLYSRLCFIILEKTYLEIQYVLKYRVPIMLVIYLTIYLLSTLVKIIKNNISFNLN